RRGRRFARVRRDDGGRRDDREGQGGHHWRTLSDGSGGGGGAGGSTDAGSRRTFQFMMSKGVTHARMVTPTPSPTSANGITARTRHSGMRDIASRNCGPSTQTMTHGTPTETAVSKPPMANQATSVLLGVRLSHRFFMGTHTETVLTCGATRISPSVRC